jgi:hypothetical protein
MLQHMPMAPDRLFTMVDKWLTAGRDVGATFQIPSNRTVYIAPPARPWTFSQLSNDELELYTQRTLMFATMLQLMLSAMDQVPSVTLVIRYDENCFGHYTDDKVLNRLDYAAMQEPSPWDEWLGNRNELLDDRSDMYIAGVMFCDFIQAYDTVDRNFMWQILQHCGMGSRYLS